MPQDPTSSRALRPAPSSMDRLRFYWLRDHGFLRSVWHNFHQLDDQIWRHNHPSPARLATLQDLGAKAVLSLRGSGSFPSEVEARACNKLDLPLFTIEMRATISPDRAVLLELLDALRTLPKPLVIHCKSGADRTGLAAALYLHVIKGTPMKEARKQLALRYAHLSFGRARPLHKFLDAFEAQSKPFEEWLTSDYEPAAL